MWECPYCGESFRQRHGLKAHIRFRRCPELSSTDEPDAPDLPDEDEEYAQRLEDGFFLQSLGEDARPED